MDNINSWRRLLVSLLIALVANVGIWSVVVVLPSIEEEFNSSRGVATLPYTLTLFGFAIGNDPDIGANARVVEHFGR